MYSAWYKVNSQKMLLFSLLNDIHKGHSADILAIAIGALSPLLSHPPFLYNLGCREQVQPAYSIQDGLVENAAPECPQMLPLFMSICWLVTVSLV